MRKILAAVLLCVIAVPAFAQYPARAVHIVVGFPPGGSTDITARLLAPKLSEKWGQPVVVENKPGAAANIGSDYVAKAAPDGHTLLLATTAIAISPSTFKALGYDALKDFSPVSMVSTIPNILVIHPSVKAQTIDEFIQLAKRQPGKMNFAAPGAASGQRMTFELIKQITGIDIVMVPYKGGAPAVQATLAGETQAMIVNVVEAVKLVEAGKLRALATTTEARAPMLPQVPTLAETVAPGLDVSVWQGVLAPAGTPAAVVAQINRDIAAALAAPGVKERLQTLGMNVVQGTPEEFGRFLAEEVARWRKVAQTAGIQPE